MDINSYKLLLSANKQRKYICWYIWSICYVWWTHGQDLGGKKGVILALLAIDNQINGYKLRKYVWENKHGKTRTTKIFFLTKNLKWKVKCNVFSGWLISFLFIWHLRQLDSFWYYLSLSSRILYKCNIKCTNNSFYIFKLISADFVNMPLCSPNMKNTSNISGNMFLMLFAEKKSLYPFICPFKDRKGLKNAFFTQNDPKIHDFTPGFGPKMQFNSQS